jgi:hypothetical protein
MKTGVFEKLLNVICNNFLQLIGIVVEIELRIKIILIKNLNDIPPDGLHAPTSCSPFLEDLKMC